MKVNLLTLSDPSRRQSTEIPDGRVKEPNHLPWSRSGHLLSSQFMSPVVGREEGREILTPAGGDEAVVEPVHARIDVVLVLKSTNILITCTYDTTSTTSTTQLLYNSLHIIV